jgi:hypothetical protein
MPQPPAAAQPNPYLPAGMGNPLVYEAFDGVDTSTNRAGVDDKHAFWLDGIMPYAHRRGKVMPGIGSVLFTAAGVLTVTMFKFANLGAAPLCVIVMSDGSIILVRTDTLTQTKIASAGTVKNPTQNTVDINQWGSQYVLIVSTQTNGYWIWDGVAFYGAGTLGPVVVLTNAGSGYSSIPSVVVTGGHGSGASLVASIGNGVVTGVSISNPGSGYIAGDTVTLTFTGGTASGSGGNLTAVMMHEPGGSGAVVVVTSMTVTAFGATITAVAVTSQGSGYSPLAIATVTGGDGPASQAVIGLNVVGGLVVSATIINGGSYADDLVAPTITVTDPGGFFVSSVVVNNGGSSYSPSTTVTASGGSVVAAATFSPVINSGVITSVVVTSPGLYTTSTPPALAVTDSSVTAQATVALMPFGIQGNAVETYSGQVWIVNNNIRYTSAPGSVTDFATSDGGLNVTASDSYLKVGYTALLNTNGFLYFVGDSSVSYVSGVQTGGTPITTTYTYQNADPEVGTIWPQTVIEWGNSLILANQWGVHLLRGSQIVKVSEPMDGVYSTVSTQTITPSAAKAIVFNRKIWCLLIQIVDPVANATQNKLLLWDGKRWWASLQDVTLKYIQGQEFDSNLTAWGTDGTHIYPLFQTASTAFTKTLQTKLWDTPGYMFTHNDSRFWAMTLYNSVASPNLVVSVDSEVNADPYMVPSSTYTIAGALSAGYFIAPPQAIGQQGVLTGMTLKTTAADVEIVSIAMDQITGEYRG